MSDDRDLELSLVRGDALMRIQRAIGLVPADGLGAGRRALVLALVSWLPLAIWALVKGRALAGDVDEPLMSHFGIHVRLLIAVPLLVIAEAVSHGISTRLFPQFLSSGLVPDTEIARFRETLRKLARLRDATLPWVVLLGALLVVLAVSPTPADNHELNWTADPAGGGFGFAAIWFSWVARPIFTILLLAWLWRLVLVFVLCARLARLDLALVPTHPDGAGGLGFLERLPAAFSPVVLGISLVLAARWAHDVRYHGVHVESLYLPMIAFGVLALVLFLAPLLPWFRLLARARRSAEMEYGALVARHGRLVRQRWILGEPVADDALLGAPELGPVADTLTLYDAARKMRSFPIARRSVVAIALPAALPMIGVLAMEIPIKDLLLKLLTTLV
jgi:hypothetical protein